MTSRAVKSTSTIAVVRGNLSSRRPDHSTANATRNRIVSTSEMLTSAPTFQCTFSHVTQNSVARKRKPVSFISRQALQQLRQLLDPGPAAEPLAVGGRQRGPVERAGLPGVVELPERDGQRRHVVRRRDQARA